MEAYQLPSGSWRVLVNLGKDKNGKPIRKSVTAKKKSEALQKAKALLPPAYDDTMTVQEACEEFLRIKGPELSPATVRGYMGTYRTYILPWHYANLPLGKLKNFMIQEWVSDIHRAPKTKANHFGFLSAAIRFFDEDRRIKVKIAEEEKEELYTPTVAEVNCVFSLLDEQTLRAAILGVFGIRRGEVCALDGEDIDREKCLVRIARDVVKDDSGKWIRKVPKTKKSVRWVELPPAVVEMLPEKGPLFTISPDQVTNRFSRAVKKSGVPHFRLHDLRSFFASTSIFRIGATEKTVQEMGGWKTNNVLKKHYERQISDQRRRDTDAILEFFSSELEVLGQG